MVIEGNIAIGRNNLVYQFATVGLSPHDLEYKGEDSQLIIGDGNTIREYVSPNPGTKGGDPVARIGQWNLLTMQCHHRGRIDGIHGCATVLQRHGGIGYGGLIWRASRGRGSIDIKSTPSRARFVSSSRQTCD